MNFEVGGRKAYKGARRQNLGSSWERIESVVDAQELAHGAPLPGSSWERIESPNGSLAFARTVRDLSILSAAAGKELKESVLILSTYSSMRSSWERIERK
jgi:predicted alpha-1,6-mannanase (GH76 family)